MWWSANIEREYLFLRRNKFWEPRFSFVFFCRCDRIGRKADWSSSCWTSGRRKPRVPRKAKNYQTFVRKIFAYPRRSLVLQSYYGTIVSFYYFHWYGVIIAMDFSKETYDATYTKVADGVWVIGSPHRPHHKDTWVILYLSVIKCILSYIYSEALITLWVFM